MTLKIRVEATHGDPGEKLVQGLPVLVNGLKVGDTSEDITVEPGQLVAIKVEGFDASGAAPFYDEVKINGDKTLAENMAAVMSTATTGLSPYQALAASKVRFGGAELKDGTTLLLRFVVGRDIKGYPQYSVPPKTTPLEGQTVIVVPSSALEEEPEDLVPVEALPAPTPVERAQQLSPLAKGVILVLAGVGLDRLLRRG